MNDFYFIAKIILLIALWVLILFCLTIILFSRKFYLSLVEIEESCNYQTKEAINSLNPFLDDISSVNLTIQKLIGLKSLSAKDALFLSTPLLTAKSRFIKGLKTVLIIAKKFSKYS